MTDYCNLKIIVSDSNNIEGKMFKIPNTDKSLLVISEFVERLKQLEIEVCRGRN